MMFGSLTSPKKFNPKSPQNLLPKIFCSLQSETRYASPRCNSKYSTNSFSLSLSLYNFLLHTKYLSLTLHYLMHPIVVKLVWSWFLSLDSPAMTNLVLPNWFSRKPQLQTLSGQSLGRKVMFSLDSDSKPSGQLCKPSTWIALLLVVPRIECNLDLSLH